MAEPCLCGDPYCASCGDPQAAALEAASEFLAEILRENQEPELRREEILDAVDKPERWRALIDAADPPDISDSEPDETVEAPALVFVSNFGAGPEVVGGSDEELVDPLRELFGDEDADAAGRLLQKLGMEVKPKGWKPPRK